MAITHRLPTPGSDSGSWGDILNDFLVQAHNADGSLQDGIITDAKVSSSAAIAKTKLATAVQTSLTAADNAAPKPTAGIDGKVVKWNNTSGQLEDASASLNATYASAFISRLRTIPGFGGLPQTAVSPPVYTRGTAGGATAISGGVLTAASQADSFTDMGAISNADANGYYLSNNNAQSVTGSSETNPWAREWYSDAPQLEVRLKGGGGPYRLAYNDGTGWAYATSAALADPGGSSTYLDLYDFTSVGGSKQRHFRLEMSGPFKFGGVYTGPTYALQRAAHDDAILFMGDSFTEPTFSDNTSPVLSGHESYAMLLGRALGYRNVWLSGSGGTGYLNPGTGTRFKFRDRVVADLINKNPQRWIIAGGLNDANREGSTPSYTAQMVHDEAVLLFNQIKAALPYSEGGVMSPFCSASPSVSLLAHRDALRTAATECGLPFYDILGCIPPSQRVVTTLAAAVTASTATSISVNASIPYGTYVQIGTPAWTTTPGAVSVKQSNGVTGSGPYAVTFAVQLGNTFSAGTPVIGYGFPWTTGQGRQGATTGSGTGDRFIGIDATHPTLLGHAALARACFAAMLEASSH
jgi:hypothetical protein